MASPLTQINNSFLSDLKSHVFHPTDIRTATLTSCSSNSNHLRAFALAIPAVWNALALISTGSFPHVVHVFVQMPPYLSERPSLTTLYEIAVYNPPHLCLLICFIYLFFAVYLSALQKKGLSFVCCHIPAPKQCSAPISTQIPVVGTNKQMNK